MVDELKMTDFECGFAGIRCCWFVIGIWFWVYVRSEGPWYNFCEMKKLRKKKRICCDSKEAKSIVPAL